MQALILAGGEGTRLRPADEHLASKVRSVLGDGLAFGIRLRYVEEPRPLGTGGAVRNGARVFPGVILPNHAVRF